MVGRLGGTPERPAVFFADAAEFRAWLEAHHATATEKPTWSARNRAALGLGVDDDAKHYE